MRKCIALIVLCVCVMFLASCGGMERYNRYYVNQEGQIVFGYNLPKGFVKIEEFKDSSTDLLYKGGLNEGSYIYIKEITKEQKEIIANSKNNERLRKQEDRVATRYGIADLYRACDEEYSGNYSNIALLEIDGHYIRIAYDKLGDSSENSMKDFKHILERELF